MLQLIEATAITEGLPLALVVTPIFQLGNIQCFGNESTIFDCQVDSFRRSFHCSDPQVGVSCEAPTCTNGDIRLRGGTFNDRGRIEICYNNVWGTVCSNGWDSVGARVACLQLGMPSSSKLLLYRLDSSYNLCSK